MGERSVVGWWSTAARGSTRSSGLYRSRATRTDAGRRARSLGRLFGASFLAAGASCASFNVFSPSDDVQLGAQAYGEVLAGQRILTSGPKVEMVERVTSRLVEAVKVQEPELGNLFEWEVKVIDDPETANAFCLPGGKMAVYTGILPVAESDAGLAVVMGHEIAHATRRHGSAAMTRQYTTAAVIEYALGGSTAQGIADIGAQLVHLKFGRGAELEADHDGLFFLAHAGYDPREAIAFWTRMNELSGGGAPAGYAEWLSTHPSDETRIAELEKLLPDALMAWRQAGGEPGPSSGK